MNTRGKINQLQILRCFAATLVLFIHAIVRVDMTLADSPQSNLGAFADLRHWGGLGVDLFFVLSGFIMLFVTHDLARTRHAQADFLTKRIIRIVPIYYVLTSLAVVLLAIAPELFNYRQRVDVPWVIASYLFIPMTSVDGVSQPVLGLGWTLNYEMYFYVVFSFCLCCKPKNAVIVLSLFFCLSIALGILFPLDNLFYKQVTNWMLLEFLFGLWLAYLYLNNRVNHTIGVMAGFIGLVLLLYTIFDAPVSGVNGAQGSFERMLWWGIPAALLTCGALTLELPDGRVSKVLVKLGDASYSIYLIQVFSLPALALIAGFLGLDTFLSKDALIILFVLLSILAGYVFYLLVERPMGSWATALLRK